MLAVLSTSCIHRESVPAAGGCRPVFGIDGTRSSLIQDMSQVDRINVVYYNSVRTYSETIPRSGDGLYRSSLVLDTDTYDYSVNISNRAISITDAATGQLGIEWSSGDGDVLFYSDDAMDDNLAGESYNFMFSHLTAGVDKVLFVIPPGNALESGTITLKSGVVSATYIPGYGWYMPTSTKSDLPLTMPASGEASYNNTMLVPGTYDIHVEYTLKSSGVASSFTADKSFTLEAGHVYSFKVNLKCDDITGNIDLDISVWEAGSGYGEGY